MLGDLITREKHIINIGSLGSAENAEKIVQTCPRLEFLSHMKEVWNGWFRGEGALLYPNTRIWVVGILVTFTIMTSPIV